MSSAIVEYRQNKEREESGVRTPPAAAPFLYSHLTFLSEDHYTCQGALATEHCFHNLVAFQA